MLKKLYFTFTLSLTIITTAFAMAPTTETSITPATSGPVDKVLLTTQLKNISAQMNVIKRAWNTERIHIKMAEKASSAVYNAVKPTIEKLIASTDFTTKMNAAVDNQFNAIINNNTPFNQVKINNNISDLFPNLKFNEYGRKLYSAMANKAYLLLLGQKLAAKAKELAAAIKSTQQEATNQANVF